MGWRFQRRIRIAPGLTLNLSKRGVGLSAGVRGARVGVGPRGVHRSVGLPGTGLSHREERSWASLASGGRGGAGRVGTRGSRGAAGGPGLGGGAGLEAFLNEAEFDLLVAEDGTVSIVDAEGVPLSPAQVREVRAAHGEVLAALLEDIARVRSGDVASLLEGHLDTPPPDPPFRFEEVPFAVPRPEPPLARSPGLLGSIVPGRRARIAEENDAAQAAWEAETRRWIAERRAHDEAEGELRAAFEAAALGSPEAMATLLEARLATLAWPRETAVSFELHDGGREDGDRQDGGRQDRGRQDRGRSVWLDVDLPPASEMPRVAARPAARGLRILEREKSDTQLRKEYMTHVHGVVFRVVGVAFHTLPGVREVVASAYTQRPDPATGAPEDQYLLSARIDRDTWGGIRFDRLAELDLPAAFTRFDLRRNMTRTGIFRPIEPHVEGAGPG